MDEEGGVWGKRGRLPGVRRGEIDGNGRNVVLVESLGSGGSASVAGKCIARLEKVSGKSGTEKSCAKKDDR